ncbi:hypothetical protein BLNAU_14822 [Blattamonas nauphoetae]|uniref:Uncharacterized protein n=1 Tax=Blattamonas nauphoetae TaxID=2049346 RepID=A0ABQ9XFZ7_9EUKA|nr:hypothetical protein BLNAU_14822 [Blattamonas nauphoetae]
MVNPLDIEKYRHKCSEELNGETGAVEERDERTGTVEEREGKTEEVVERRDETGYVGNRASFPVAFIYQVDESGYHSYEDITLCPNGDVDFPPSPHTKSTIEMAFRSIVRRCHHYHRSQAIGSIFSSTSSDSGAVKQTNKSDPTQVEQGQKFP